MRECLQQGYLEYIYVGEVGERIRPIIFRNISRWFWRKTALWFLEPHLAPAAGLEPTRPHGQRILSFLGQTEVSGIYWNLTDRRKSGQLIRKPHHSMILSKRWFEEFFARWGDVGRRKEDASTKRLHTKHQRNKVLISSNTNNVTATSTIDNVLLFCYVFL
jgi:hypothetical protein